MTPTNKLDQPEVTALLFPQGNNKISPCPLNGEDLLVKTVSGESLTCRLYSGEKDAPIIIFFPATDDETQDFNVLAQSYLNHGINFFLATYRGCYGNSGNPSVSGMFSDSAQTFEFATSWLSQNGYTGNIFVMGQGLGSVCTLDTVVNHDEQIKGMFIESGICSTNGYLSGLGLENFIIDEAEGFNVIEKIEKIKNPSLMFHGARDTIVPISEAENLQASSGARTKQFFVIPGAERHSVSKTGGDLYFESIKKFIDTVSGVNTWRQKRRKYKESRQG